MSIDLIGSLLVSSPPAGYPQRRNSHFPLASTVGVWPLSSYNRAQLTLAGKHWQSQSFLTFSCIPSPSTCLFPVVTITDSPFCSLNLILITAVTFFCSALPLLCRKGEQKAGAKAETEVLTQTPGKLIGATGTFILHNYHMGMDYFPLLTFLEIQSLGLVTVFHVNRTLDKQQKRTIDSQVHETKLQNQN